ncbi:MAG: type I-F CRISPR-associated protein Csy3, partial [Methylococcales bacterium]|nr:type I-F CRISPR-associated protein Csy3 [Methylococcales bacterium]
MAKNKNIASVLAFEKKLIPSDGYMFATTWNDKENITPLKLKEKSVRGTISNRLKAAVKNDPDKLNSEIEKPNLQTVDFCALGTDQDTLKLQFTLKFLGGVETPSACNNAEFNQSYTLATKKYIEDTGFTELAKRYALNIANARFLWRNRVGAENIQVDVKMLNKNNDSSWVFDAKKYNLRDFDQSDKNIKSLATLISTALSEKDNFLLLDINAYVEIGKAQEVYPSEELVLDKGKGRKS